MADQVLADIDYPRYQRWLNRALCEDRPLAILDAAGRVLWSHCEQDWSLPPGCLDDMQGPQASGAGVNEGSAFLYRPLRVNGSGVVGWAGIALHDAACHASPDVERAGAALEDIAAGIAAEAAQKSDLLKLTEGLAQSYEQLSLIYDINQHVQARGHDVEVFQTLLQSMAERMDVDLVAFVRPADRMCVHAGSSDADINDLDLLLVELTGDLFRFVQSLKEVVVINDAQDARRSYLLPGRAYRILACPVCSERKVDGVAVLLNRIGKAPFTASDRRLAEVLASQLASLARSCLLIRNMRMFTGQLATVLVAAIDAKDPYTRGHSERVNALAMKIGTAFGLQDDELEDLHWGSLLHDVGKLAIPDAILRKPERLTEDEQTFIKAHPERSYEMLRHVEHLKEAMPAVRHHHERMDGNGYPDGLKGRRIPLHARLIAVADTYDAITSSRAYRPGATHEKALAEMERVAGSQLDSELVDVFRRLCADEPDWLNGLCIRREGAA